jgi:hypothetical protein
MNKFLVFCVPLAFIPQAHADWAYTKWGMTVDQVVAASHGTVTAIPKAQQQTLEGAHVVTAAQGTYTEGDLRLRTAFQFDTENGGLRCILYAPQSPSQDTLLKQSLVQRYGTPQQSSIVSLETLTWHAPADDIDMEIVEKEISAVFHCKGKT